MKKTSPFFGPRLVASNGSAFPADAGDEHRIRFRQQVLPHLDGAYNLARYLTRDPVLSEDVVQDAFLRAFRAFDQFRGDSPRAWLFAIVRNCCRSIQSAPATTRSINESDLSARDLSAVDARSDPSGTPEDQAIRQGEIDGVRTAIEAIPEPFREAIVLRDIEGFSYAEIAEVTGVPIGTVMSRLSRARETLAKILLPAQTMSEPTSDSGRSAK